MSARDLTNSDFAGLELQSRRQRFVETQFAAMEDEEGDVLGAARWFVICLGFVVLAAGSAFWSLM